MATILEKLQKKYPNAKGINKANNIAEAVACIHGLSGREGNTIADNIWPLYTLTFNLNGGSGTVAAITSAPIQPVTLPGGTGLTPASGKEAFLGWGETDDATEFVTGQIYLKEDTTLYAIWGDVFTIAFNANGGTGTIESVTCPDGSSVELPDGTDLTAPEGKQFVGWGDTALSTEAIASPYTPETDGTLYAIWADEESAEP